MKVLFNEFIGSIELFSLEDLENIRDEINREIEYRENEKLINLKKDAIAALREFLNAGGYILTRGTTYTSIDEKFDSNERIISLS